MNYLPKDLQIQVLAHLVEGCSIRTTSRLTKVSRGTILSLLETAGIACKKYQDEAFVNLKFKKVQADEIWAFCYSKKKNATDEMKMKYLAGDAWTWIASDVKSRLVFSWLVGGPRNQQCADAFLGDANARISTKFQMTTDGNKYYLDAIQAGIIPESKVDYGILMKTYVMKDGKRDTNNLKLDKIHVLGDPNEKDISTSYIERFNLTLRTNIRRFTRKTNGFTKKMDNLEHHIALFCMYYNFVREHSTFGRNVTPAMIAGVCDYKWEWNDLIDMVNGIEAEHGYSAVA